MLNELKTVKNLIEYLEDRKDELTEHERNGYDQALRFLDEYLTDTQDELEFEYADNKYAPAESYYWF